MSKIVNAVLAKAESIKAALSMQRYVDTPVAGRLAPQPNNDMFMTKLVKGLLQVK